MVNNCIILPYAEIIGIYIWFIHIFRVNEKNDGVYDDDGDYKPTEEQVSTSEDEMSSDSFVSATEDSDDDEEENTAMDE